MKTIYKPNALARGLKNFFSEHLPNLRGMSPHTIHSYRDSLILLLRFIANQRKCSITDLDVKDFNSANIIVFLQHLEDERHNSVTTRNIRLAAIHAFSRYLAETYPDKLEHYQQVLTVPFKRANTRIVEYLEYDEIQAVLAAVDRSTKEGVRDYTLFITMFNTGARVQEILDMRLCDLQLIKPYQVRLTGKGRKQRLCPLWEKSAQLLKELIAEHNAQSNAHVFLNHRKEPLTRFGVRYLLQKYCNLAKKNTPTLVNKRLHPHSLRHSTAIYLLKSGVDIVTISQWLGHTSINTTNKYASIDLDMKREAINKITVGADKTTTATWKSDTSILTWLESL